MAHGALTPISGLRLLALAAGLRHNAEIGQPGLCFSAYGHKFGINHLVVSLRSSHARTGSADTPVPDGTRPRAWRRRRRLRVVHCGSADGSLSAVALA